MKYKMFCYVCKKHIEIESENKKEANLRFISFGHDDTKVSQLKRNIKLSY